MELVFCALPTCVLAYTSRWEYDCCSEPLSLGQTTRLQLQPMTREEQIWPKIDHQRIDWYATHHDTESTLASYDVEVKVLAIWEAFCDYEIDLEHGWQKPIEGTGQLIYVDQMVISREDLDEPIRVPDYLSWPDPRIQYDPHQLTVSPNTEHAGWAFEFVILKYHDPENETASDLTVRAGAALAPAHDG